MYPPIACFTCGKLISKFCVDYQDQMKKNKEKSKETLDSFGLKRYCCRTAVMTYTDISQDLPFGKGM